MLAALSLLFLSFSCLLAVVTAQGPADPRLTGTWSTKSKKVLTGPGFYDPINDRFKEPSHTGISYSFTDDGFYEEAYFRAVSDPTRPDCAKGIMQFQHGRYKLELNGSLVLTPFSSDGRQLVSDPCAGENAEYYRYTQPELFQRYEVQIDPFHKIERLNIYRFDGSPLNPMYLVLRPPQMLPTRTLNPTDTPGAPATTTAAAAGERKVKVKRADGIGSKEKGSFEFGQPPLSKSSFVKRMDYYHSRMDKLSSTDKLWWLGVVMTSIGGVALIYK
ncbi:protein ROT1 [[Emmonsia] crescens]|uniref:Protein ROT1 n=1 Tax=[Emmonsia] crescens TaxID=73230 RepID=A0A0G2J2P4_9EURO|nr:protein ROT1 [Emmonsia crescens UAMH 3008]